MFGQLPTSPPPIHASKEKINVLVSLPSLSSQDREHHKEAVLSASNVGNSISDQCQRSRWSSEEKCLRKGKRQRERNEKKRKKKENRESCEVEGKEGIANCEMDRKSAKMLTAALTKTLNSLYTSLVVFISLHLMPSMLCKIFLSSISHATESRYFFLFFSRS